jgi:hypothetical protein
MRTIRRPYEARDGTKPSMGADWGKDINARGCASSPRGAASSGAPARNRSSRCRSHGSTPPCGCGGSSRRAQSGAGAPLAEARAARAISGSSWENVRCQLCQQQGSAAHEFASCALPSSVASWDVLSLCKQVALASWAFGRSPKPPHRSLRCHFAGHSVSRHAHSTLSPKVVNNAVIKELVSERRPNAKLDKLRNIF